MIFDRWGEEVFGQQDFFPNEISNGWDGKMKGKLLNSQVLVVYVEVLFLDGTTERFYGDLTIMN